MAYPILAAKNTWWKPNVSSVTRASITEIEIMDSYTPDSSVTVVDSWDASAAQDGSITCYVIGTKLIIVGNGSGKIAANENSTTCFGGYNSANRFTNMATFIGSDLFDTSNVTSMDSMFCGGGSAFTTIDLSTWDVSRVKNMRQMFAMSCFTSITGLENWDVSSVTNMQTLFGSCFQLNSVGDLSKWDVSTVELMNGLFYDCRALTSIGDISNWDVSNVTGMMAVFFNCQKLVSLDLSKWNVSKVTSMHGIFDSCESMTSLGNLSDWNFPSCTDISFMFYGCSSLGEIDVSKWDVSKVTNFDHFAAHANLKRKGIENWNTSSATNMNAMFHNCAEEELDLSGWDVSKVQFFCQMFENSPNLKRIKGLENWDTSSGLGFDGMFERCYVLEELDLSSFDTSKAKNGVEGSTNGHLTATLQNMFLSCNNLRKITLGSNFAVNGDGTNTTAANKLILPTPSTDYIEGADGMWYNFTGESFAPNAMKDKTAETYYASYDIVADIDVIVKNGSLIDTARAIRMVNSEDARHTPSQFGEAVEGAIESIIDRSITEVRDDIEVLGPYAFGGCTALTTADFPELKEIGTSAFFNCNTLTTINCPKVTTIRQGAFSKCTALKTVDLLNLTTMESHVLQTCSSLNSVNFPLLTSMGIYALSLCDSLSRVDLGKQLKSIPNGTFLEDAALTILILRSETVVALGTGVFNSTPIASGTGYIYVPSALVDTYKAATNWSTYANQFRALEDYTVDGTITGELDESKI